jgi:hypothetical protein
MKGYIYTMFQGADPGNGWRLTDPIFGKKPTLGACMPNIRRLVTEGDHIFSISGRVEGVRQYVVGGFEVQEKIDALAAYRRFPENRQRREPDGNLTGNIIVTEDGKRSPVDYHSNFEKRLDNYVVGCNHVMLKSAHEVERGRGHYGPLATSGREASEPRSGLAREHQGKEKELA